MPTICVKPSPNIFKQLAHTNQDFCGLLSEFIDNAIAEMQGGSVEVCITIGGPWVKISGKNNSNNRLDAKKAFICVEDNANGIPFEKLADALSPAALAGNDGGLHEHGVGMKTAIAGLRGDNGSFLLTTRTKGMKKAVQIQELGFGDIPYSEIDDFPKHGSTIRVDGLSGIVPLQRTIYTRDVIPTLGAKYRLYLNETSRIGKRLTLKLKLVNENGSIIHVQNIDPIIPLYSGGYPNIIKNKTFSGDGWSALVRVGDPITVAECTANQIEIGKFHPYPHGSSKIDIIMHNRVIKQCDHRYLGWHKFTSSAFFAIRGEIELLEGFETSFTKDGIQETLAFQQLKEEVCCVIEPSLSNRKGDKAYTREADLVAKLYTILSQGLGRNVKREYSIEASAGHVDLVVDGVAWECKLGQADGQNAFQLLWYVCFGADLSKDDGVLVASSFSPGCIETVNGIKEKFKVNITLKKWSDFGLTPVVEDSPN